jgi:hypothetical protein
LRGEVNELAGNFCHMIGLDQYQLKMMDNRVVLTDQRVEWLIKRLGEADEKISFLAAEIISLKGERNGAG